LIVLADGSAGGRVTDNVHEDLVQDWQPLRDVAAPVVHALKSGGPRSKTMRFRFRLAESSGGAIVDLDFSYRSGNGATEGHATQPFKGARSGHVFVIAFPWGAGKGAPAAFRFCVQATDASANVGKRICAWFRFLPTKKTKRR
jgi:hypothetical protein